MVRRDSDIPSALFEALYGDCYASVHAYALRRADPDTAQEVVADTFLTAWRRFDEVPHPPLPWLYGVARRTLANARRTRLRAQALVERAAPARTPPSDDAAERLGESEMIRAALMGLSERDREALMLVAWEDLEPADAARAAGCSRPTFAVRLHRARRRLAHALVSERDTPSGDLSLEEAR